MWIISMICLFIVGVCCTLAVFCPCFKDNLAQCIGLGTMALGCAARLESLWSTQLVYPETLMMHIGMATFSLGLAWRTHKTHRCGL